MGVLIQRGLLYCSTSDGEKGTISGSTHGNSIAEYSTALALVNDLMYDGMTKVPPLESTISLSSNLEAAVYRALSVGNRSDSQPLKLMFSVCQALGLLGYVLLVETRTEGKKDFNDGELPSSGNEKEEDLRSNKNNLWTIDDKTKKAKQLDYGNMDLDDRLQSHKCILQIVTIMTAMLRQGVVKVSYYSK